MSARAFLDRLRLRARSRHELDRLSERQLRDINLERVVVSGTDPIYRRRLWQSL